MAAQRPLTNSNTQYLRPPAIALIVLCACACCRKEPIASGPDSAGGAPLVTAPVIEPATPPATAKPATPTARMPASTSVAFLHHSTGENVWNGGVAAWFDSYNQRSQTRYAVVEMAYPHDPYPWENYPYDYWNIWVQHAGPSAFQGQETLEMLTPRYQVIVFKHCFPVSGIAAGDGPADVSSSDKTLANYRAQYDALKPKLRSFANTRFVLWTGAALTRASMRGEYGGNDDTARRSREFFSWVKATWDQPGDNIFLFDFYELETEGGTYLQDKYAVSAGDSHPNERFAKTVAPKLAQRIVDVIEGRGDTGSRTGG